MLHNQTRVAFSTATPASTLHGSYFSPYNNANARLGKYAAPAPVVIITLGAVCVVILSLLGLELRQSVPLALLTSIVGQRMVRTVQFSGDFFHPVVLVGVYFLNYFSLRATYVYLDPESNRVGQLYYDDYLPLSLLYATLGFVFFVLGTQCAARGRMSNFWRVRLPEWTGRVPSARITLALMVGAAATFYLFSHGARNVGNLAEDVLQNKFAPMPGTIVLLSTLIKVGTIAVFAWLVSTRKGGRGRMAGWICFWLGVGLNIANFARTGSKQDMIEPAFCLLMIYHYLRHRVSLRTALLFGLPAIIASFGFLNIYRYVIIEEAGGTPRSLGDLAQDVTYAAEYFRRGASDNVGSQSVLSFLQRPFGADSLALVVKYTPERKPFGLGRAYLDIPAQVLVPRQLWNDKPIDYFTGAFEETYAVGWKDGYTSPHLIADLYQNFHVFGIAAGMFLMGIVLRGLYIVCQPWRGHPQGAFAYAALIPGLVHAFEWEPVAICQYFIRYAVLIFFFVWFLRTQKGSAVRMRTEPVWRRT